MSTLNKLKEVSHLLIKIHKQQLEIVSIKQEIVALLNNNEPNTQADFFLHSTDTSYNPAPFSVVYQ